jgi:hypothetical protein
MSAMGPGCMKTQTLGKAHGPDLRFHRADDRAHDFDGRAMDPTITVIPGFTRSRKA